MRTSMLKTILRQPCARSLSTQPALVDVQVNDKTGIATVTMQRAPVNSINLELAQDLTKAIKDLTANKSRGMILTSAQSTVFSAGLDILEMHKPEPDRVRSFWSALQDLWLALYSTPFPTAAAINGHAPAGGCLLACSCEYRVMVKPEGRPYTIGLNETQLGILPPTWFIDTFQNVLPRREAELGLTAGKLFTVDEARSIGLVDELATDKEDALAKSEKWFSIFARVHPVARAQVKKMLRGPAVERLAKNKEADLNMFLGLVTAEKTQQALTVYLESLKKKSS